MKRSGWVYRELGEKFGVHLEARGVSGETDPGWRWHDELPRVLAVKRQTPCEPEDAVTAVDGALVLLNFRPTEDQLADLFEHLRSWSP